MKYENGAVRKRMAFDRGMEAIGFFIVSLLILVVLSIFLFVIGNGLSGINIKILTTDGNTTSGGLFNAIIGTWLLTGVGLTISLPVGLFGAVYISEYSNSRAGSFLKLFADLLTGIPSIVLGFFGYLMIVVYLRFGFSLLAGGIILAIMMIPYILRISEISLSNIPKDIREAAYALGADKYKMILRVLLSKAKSGVIVGSVLAVSIASGETAQLLYTAGWNNGLPTGLTNSEVGYLTYVVWQGINQPSAYSHQLAFAAAFVLLVMILALILMSKYVQRGK